MVLIEEELDSIATLKTIASACFAFLVFAGCSKREFLPQNHCPLAQESPIDIFKEIINSSGDLVFTDTVKQGPGPSGVSIKLKFLKDSNLTIEEFGYGIDIFHYASSINPDGDLAVINQGSQTFNWQTLVIFREGDRLTLGRKDGLRSFKEHGNFWPNIVDRVFPVEARLPKNQEKW